MNSGLVGALGAAPLRVTGLTRRIVTSGINANVNALQLQATGGSKNVDFVLTPKGTGAFIAGTESGAVAPSNAWGVGYTPNKRGILAVDLQRSGIANTEVASGIYSFAAGIRNTASGACAIAIGMNNQATQTASFASSVSIGSNSIASGAYGSIAIGNSVYSTGQQALATGEYTQASGNYSFCSGRDATAYIHGMNSHASGGFTILSGDAQTTKVLLRNRTTTNSAVELFLDGSSIRRTIPSGKILSCLINIVGTKSDGTAVAQFVRKACIKNVAGTTSLVNSVETIGTDSANGTSVSITANDTNDALNIEVTGITSETWRWVASIEGVEIAYGT